MLLYTAIGANAAEDVGAPRWRETASPLRFWRRRFEGSFARFSPDGHWVTYASNESGQYEVYVRPSPPTEPRAGSTDGGSRPRWGRDGKELFFISAESKLIAVSRQSSLPLRPDS